MAGGSQPPVSVVAGWPAPNYVNPVRHSIANVVIIGILAVLALTAVVLRIWSRFKLQKNVGLDDWLFLAGMPFAFAHAITTCLITRVFHEDRHIWDLVAHDFVVLRKFHFASCMLYLISTTAMKMSVLCFIRRLTNRSISASFIYIVWACMLSEVVQFSVCVGTLCLGCNPISAYWNQYAPSWLATHTFTCITEGPSLFIMSVVSVVQDFIATVLPFTLFLRTRLDRRQKIALSATFAGGLVVVGAGSYRSFAAYRTYFLTYDMTWSAYEFVTASAIEILLATIVASAPALKYYIRHTIDARRASPRNSDAQLIRPMQEAAARRQMSGYTITTIQSDCDSEVGYLNKVDTSTSVDKNKLNFCKETISELSEWQDEVVDWQRGRSLSRQEDELLLNGIISLKPADLFDRGKRCWVTNDPRPVHYPWEDSGPGDTILGAPTPSP